MKKFKYRILQRCADGSIVEGWTEEFTVDCSKNEFAHSLLAMEMTLNTVSNLNLRFHLTEINDS